MRQGLAEARPWMRLWRIEAVRGQQARLEGRATRRRQLDYDARRGEGEQASGGLWSWRVRGLEQRDGRLSEGTTRGHGGLQTRTDDGGGTVFQ